MPLSENPFFIKKKYPELHMAPDVVRVAKRTERKTGEKTPETPTVRIQNYLDRFREVIERPDPAERERGLEAIKRLMRQAFVIRPQNIPESAFLLEQRIARELGHGTVELSDEFREAKTKEIISNQTQSLENWIDYLSSPDAQYPDWAKYWAFRSMTEMGKFEKEEDEDGKETGIFRKRAKDTVASFPPLNPRALAMTIGVLQSKLEEETKPKKDRRPVTNQSAKLTDPEFQKLLSTENFSKIYAQFLIEMPEYSTEGLQETRGIWKTYPQGSDPEGLVKSLEGYPLEWCTANTDTARTQLQGGDFHVYYSLNQQGEPIIPRVAIRMEHGEIAEVRGIAPNQNLDPYIGEVVQKKMAKFPDGKEYEKKAADMKRLTAIEKKMAIAPLSKDDLIFLYEINSPIQGFGYQKDPRIKELRDRRNPKEDAPIVFECQPNEVAWKKEDVNETTKAYVGPLFPGIFKKLAHLEHVYTTFPEGKITWQTIEIGGQTKEQFESALEKAGMKIGDSARHILKQIETGKKPEQVDLVRLKVGDLLGYDNMHTTDEIYKKADELGLELCPAEVGPQYRLQHTDQPMNEWICVGMKQIAVPGGVPRIFDFGRDTDGTWLGSHWAKPTDLWGQFGRFVFRLRK
jgi:hypothetical protein